MAQTCHNFNASLYDMRYPGTMATFLANILSHYSWFYTHNLFDAVVPTANSSEYAIVRSGFIGDPHLDTI
jgi:hypothetical protein